MQHFLPTGKVLPSDRKSSSFRQDTNECPTSLFLNAFQSQRNLKNHNSPLSSSKYLRITTNFHLKVTTHHKASRTTLLSLCLTAPTLGCSSKLHPSNSNLNPNRRETKSSKKV
ncbi:hypothetical protein TVAGG3_0019030 [Trichomonas vaginalis G3]|uniref:hypothetical protein n=1 Tax=Trichomonas vaginalis (strain ATCC PRA-98 / G3) TaxID=412133 RepID=UPI0021E5D4D6|nr:hypothetical protein TVAGG3_0019030 [Trichomonas vaginalis G3]KAI5539561.1 hypothetical protein TVAGG3_0019030 [Trichomonas vaginalis G3]